MNRYWENAFHKDTLILPAIILKIVSFHDFSLKAAWTNCSMSILSNCFDISVFQIHQNVISKQIINKNKNLFCIKNQKISRHLAANRSRINSTLSNVFIFRFCNLMYLFAKRSQQICSCDYGIPNVNNNLPFRWCFSLHQKSSTAFTGTNLM